MSDAVDVDGHIVVVGASLGGMRAIQALRENGFRGVISCIGDEPHFPYDRPPLSKQIVRGEMELEKLALLRDEERNALGVDWHLGVPAQSLDVKGTAVTLADTKVIKADAVVVATGARPRMLTTTSLREGIFVIRTLEDALSLRRALTSLGEGVRVVVIGAGFIGAEVAASAKAVGAKVDLVEALPIPMAGALGDDVGAWVSRLHSRNGVVLHTGVGVSHLDGKTAPGAGAAGAVVLEDGTVLAADLIVVGIGVMPNTEWLEESGLVVNNGVKCDERLFAAPNVVAVGDVARWQWVREKDVESVRIEHWDIASQMGTHAAKGLLAGRADAEIFDPVPYFWSDLYDLRVQVLGHPRRSDELVLVEGDPQGDDPRFVALYGREGMLSGAVGLSRPRAVMLTRPLLVKPTPLSEAVAKLTPKSD